MTLTRAEDGGKSKSYLYRVYNFELRAPLFRNILVACDKAALDIAAMGKCR